MTRMHNGVVTKGKEHGSDRSHERVIVSAGKVGSADRSSKERVANKQICADRAPPADLQTHAARTMTRGVMRSYFVLPERDNLPWRVKSIDRRLGAHSQPEHGASFDNMLVQEKVVVM